MDDGGVGRGIYRDRRVLADAVGAIHGFYVPPVAILICVF